MLPTHLTTLTHTGRVPLKNMSSGEIIEAEAYSGVSDELLLQTETKWRPLCRRLDLEDSHWTWRDFKKGLARRANKNSIAYSIVHNDILQGLILLEDFKLMNHATDRGRKAIYVAYIAAAPWNRRKAREHPQWSSANHGYGEVPYFVGTGKSLITIATALSEEKGYSGRLVLESTPDALAFYEKRCHFTRVSGRVSERGLTRLELTTAGLRRFRDGVEEKEGAGI